MVFSDIIKEYVYVNDLLEKCSVFFDACNQLITPQYTMLLNISSEYFKAGASETNKNNLITKIDKSYSAAFDIIIKMVTQSYYFYGVMFELENFSPTNPHLNEEISYFLTTGNLVKDAINEIMTAKLPGTKTNSLLPKLITPLRRLLEMYHTLRNYSSELSSIDSILFENTPNEPSEKYNCLEIRSLKHTLNITSFSKDIEHLASFIVQYEQIISSETWSSSIFTHKIESGSLRVVFGSNTIELSGIPEIIRAISDGVKMFRLTSSEKKILEEQARSSKLDNDLKELAIINSQIAQIAQITGLSSDEPADVEKLQKLCLPLVRYINNNPIGMVGEYQYNLDNDLKLIEAFYNE